MTTGRMKGARVRGLLSADDTECSCAMTEGSMRTCPLHGENQWLVNPPKENAMPDENPATETIRVNRATLATLLRQHDSSGFSSANLGVRWDPSGALVEAQVLLCSQCGDEPSAMVKVGTDDGWCIPCLDEAANEQSARCYP